MLPRVLATFALLFSAALGNAQAPAAPSYDVAVIRQSDPSTEGHVSISENDTVYTTVGTTPRILLQDAFEIPRDLIFDLPTWAEQTRYDLSAKDSTTDPAILKKLPEGAYRKMLQALLVERFGLRTHTEMREVTAYELTYVRPAPGLKKVEVGVENMSISNQHMESKGVTLSMLAKKFGDELHRPVVDHTGLQGFYDVDLRWRRDDEAANAAAADDPEAPPILLTAVQEQLGLKLRSGKQTVPVLVIDRITPPSAN